MVLRGNVIERVPFTQPLAGLVHLDLRQNHVRTLPQTLCALPQLVDLLLEANPLQDPPIEIALQGLSAIRFYFEKDKVVLGEAKVVVLGNGMVGKTSLVRNLRDYRHRRPFDYLEVFTKGLVIPREDERTVGIEVYDFELPDHQGLSVHAWDMAGQLEYQPYHQTFLSERAVNIIVWKVNDLVHLGFPTVTHTLKRWLNSIANAASRWRGAATSPSSSADPNSRSSRPQNSVNQKEFVMFVGNTFSDDRDFVEYMTFLKPSLDQVQTFCQTVCSQYGLEMVSFDMVNCRTSSGIPEVRNTLATVVRDRIHFELSSRFVTLKAQLAASYPSQRGFVIWTRQNFVTFAHKVGGLSVVTDETLVALRAFHNLGVLFYKPDADLVVLNPHALPKLSGNLVRTLYPTARKASVSREQVNLDHLLNERPKGSLVRSLRAKNGVHPERLFDLMLQLEFFFEDCYTGSLIFPFTLSPKPPKNQKLLLVPKGYLGKRLVFEVKRLVSLGFIYQLAREINQGGRERGIKIDEMWQKGLRLVVLKSTVFAFVTLDHSEDSVYLDIHCLPEHLSRFKRVQSFLVSALTKVLSPSCDITVPCGECFRRGESPSYPSDYYLAFRSLPQASFSSMSSGSPASSDRASFSSSGSAPSTPLEQPQAMDPTWYSGVLVLKDNQDLLCTVCGHVNTPHELLEPTASEEEKRVSLDHIEHSIYGKAVYVIYLPEKRAHLFDVVFIHGLTGHPWKTWTNNQQIFWPKDWLAEDLQHSARILTVGYNSYLSLWQRSSTITLQQRTEEILNSLLDCGIGDRPVIFVGHSMGGLQIKSLLVLAQQRCSPQFRAFVEQVKPKLKHYKVFEQEYRHRLEAKQRSGARGGMGSPPPLERGSGEELLGDGREQRFLENCYGLAFYGVPHLGSNLASLMISLSSITHPTHAIHDLHPTSRSLVSLQDDFLQLCQTHPHLKSNILNLIEQEKVFGIVQIVETWSSTLPAEFSNVLLPKSHIDICTPESKSEESYSLLLLAIQKWTSQREVAHL